MREKIICRFDNENDLLEFCKLNNLNLSNETVKYSFVDGSHKVKANNRTKNKRPEIDKHDCQAHWVGMPEYISEKQKVYAKIEFEFGGDLELANKVFNQNITDKTTSVWFPKLVAGKYSTLRVFGGRENAKYPIYVVSKGRKDKCYTSIFLTRMEQPHYVVVEPSEAQDYKESVENKYCKVLSLDMRYKDEYDTFDDLGDGKSKGPGGARNFCWEHSIKEGYEWHWVMDDNASEGFHYMFRNQKVKCRTGTIFRACEDFVERYSNVAIAGLNYSKFCKMTDKTPPFVLNTRIYSFLLIRNDIPYRWRGRYNEDTDLSLRVLKDGLCTVQFNAFLAGKATTQTVGGGNTDEFYSKEGTLPKSQMLADMHPDLAEVVWKFNRWHHIVDYSVFKQKLELKEAGILSLAKVDNYGLVIVDTTEKATDDDKSYLENKYKNQKNLLTYEV